MRARPAPRSAEYAKEVIAELRRDCRSKKARIRMAELAISMGNYTEDACDVWREYLAMEAA